MARILVPGPPPAKWALDDRDVRQDMRFFYRKLRSFVVWGKPWGKREPIDIIRRRRFQTANLEGTGPADYYDDDHGWFADKSSTSVNDTNWVDNDTLIIPRQDRPVAWGMKYITKTDAATTTDVLWWNAVTDRYNLHRTGTDLYARLGATYSYVTSLTSNPQAAVESVMTNYFPDGSSGTADVKWWFNGEKKTTNYGGGTASNTLETNDYAFSNFGQYGGTLHSKAGYQCAWVIQDGLSDAAGEEITADPWALVRYDSSRRFVGGHFGETGAAGTKREAPVFDRSSSHRARNITASPVANVPITFAIWFKPSSLDEASQTRYLFGIGMGQSNNPSNYLRVRVANDWQVVAHRSGTTGSSQPNIGQALPNTWNLLVYRLNSDGTADASLNGGALQNNATVCSWSSDFESIYLGRNKADNNYFEGGIGPVCIWDGAITDQQMLDLWDDDTIPLPTDVANADIAWYDDMDTIPATTISPDIGSVDLTWQTAPTDLAPGPEMELYSAGGSTVSLAGSSSATATSTGDVSVTKSLAGTASASSTTVGALSLNVALGGEAAATATTAGDISATRGLAGSSSASSTTAGDVSVTLRLAGASSATSTTAGDISMTRGLAGACNAAATVSGDLSIAGAVSLAGAIAANSTLAGSLSLDVALEGDCNATATTSGTLRGAVPISGSSSASSTTAGALSMTRGLAGDCNAAATVSGAIDITRGLVGASSANSTVTGGITMGLALAGIVAATSTVTGDLTIQGVFDAGVQDVWTVPAKGRAWMAPDKGRTWNS